MEMVFLNLNFEGRIILQLLQMTDFTVCAYIIDLEVYFGLQIVEQTSIIIPKDNLKQ